MSRLRVLRRHPWWTAGAAAALVGFTAFVFVYFAPQDLFLQTSVNEALPAATQSAPTGRPASSPGAATRSTPGTPHLAAVPAVLGQGGLRSGEHDTSGRVELLRLADGRRFVRLERLATSNGPAVRVWLSAAPAGASDGAVGRAAHLDLGGLKANHGNQNYRVPTGAAVAGYRSVVIWCRRFDVVFGSAPLSDG